MSSQWKDLLLSPKVMLEVGKPYRIKGIRGGIGKFVSHERKEGYGLSRATHRYVFHNMETNRDFTLKSKARIIGPVVALEPISFRHLDG